MDSRFRGNNSVGIGHKLGERFKQQFVIDKINREVGSILKLPETRDAMLLQGATPAAPCRSRPRQTRYG